MYLELKSNETKNSNQKGIKSFLGTRETKVKKNKSITDEMPWYHILWFKLTEVFFCCFKQKRNKYAPVAKDEEEAAKEEKVYNCLFCVIYILFI